MVSRNVFGGKLFTLIHFRACTVKTLNQYLQVSVLLLEVRICVLLQPLILCFHLLLSKDVYLGAGVVIKEVREAGSDLTR